MNDRLDGTRDAKISDLGAMLREAESTPFEGWDFGWLRGRLDEEPEPWDFRELVRARMRDADRAIDLGTGGGEFLGSCAPLARMTLATEAWPPNVPVAARRLRNLAVPVIATMGARDNADQPDPSDRSVPFRDASFDLVVSRHEAYAPREVARVLRRGGRFLTQQVGNEDAELRAHFDASPTPTGLMPLRAWRQQLEEAGLVVLDAREAVVAKRFRDVGAVAYYLRAIPWVVPGFTVETRWAALRSIHEHIAAHGSFKTTRHRILLEAQRT